MAAAPADRDGFVDRVDADGAGPRLAVKDMIAVAGLLQTAGLSAHATRRATVDADVVARFVAAGYRIAGTTATDTAGFGTMTPAVANPRHPERAVGGSSGGAAAAVAAGAAELGLGTDTGGSVRIPAAYCDLWAFKASNGRVPMDGVIPLAPTFDALGLLAAGPGALSDGVARLLPDFAPAAPAAPPRVAVDGDVRGALDPVLAAPFEALAAALGASAVFEPPSPYLPAALAHAAIVAVEAYATYRSDAAYLGDDLPGDVMEAMEQAARMMPSEVAAARAAVREMSDTTERMFAQTQVDVVIAPTLPMPPAPPEATRAVVRGVSHPITNANIRLTFRANIAGLPVVVAPVRGMSLQFIGRRGSDETLLAHALRLVSDLG